MDSWDINDKVVLVTGAANGIGAATVQNFLENGVKHVAILDIDIEVGKALEQEMNAKYGAGKSTFIKTDVTKDDELFNAYEDTVNKHGYVDVVVNNAGILNDSPEGCKLEIEINFSALITSSLMAFEVMNRNKGGKGGTIINISSVAALDHIEYFPIYSATKSAVLQFSCSIGSENIFKQTGVRVLTVCFGATDTAILNDLRCFDKSMVDVAKNSLNNIIKQKPESAARGIIEAYKHGKSASTWLVYEDKSPKDITNKISEAYKIMSSTMD